MVVALVPVRRQHRPLHLWVTLLLSCNPYCSPRFSSQTARLWEMRVR